MQSASQAGHQELSHSVQRVCDWFRLSRAVSAFALVKELLAHHDEYGSGAPRPKLADPPPRARQLAVDEWVAELRTLFDPQQAPLLHGRLAVVGLALLEPRLGRRLRVGGFLHAVIDEIDPSLESALSEDGARRYERLKGKPESVPLLSDRPAEVDKLNRQAFAEAIAERIERVRFEDCESGAFLVHLYGPWGIGKTSLLGSPRGAVAVLQRTRDPMGIVKRRFDFLIRRIDAPVAIFIDDLDRCRSDYVVELLEGIQTLFVTSQVTYVVAADRGWLCESYAKIYEDFAS